MIAKERANKVHEEYPYTGVDWIYELLDYLGILYFEEEMDRVPSLYLVVDGKPAIIVDKLESSAKKRELIAHELAHHFFHIGNGILNKKRNPLLASRDERRAEVFALYLLVPEERLNKLINVIDPPSLEELADEFGVTVEFMAKRLEEGF